MNTFIIKFNRELNDDNYQNNQASNQSTKPQELRREIKKTNSIKKLYLVQDSGEKI